MRNRPALGTVLVCGKSGLMEAGEKRVSRGIERLVRRAANREQGVSFSFRELVLGQPDPPAPVASLLTGPVFGPYADAWLAGCEARGLKHTTHRAYKVILEAHLKPAFREKHLSEIDRKAVREFALTKPCYLPLSLVKP